MTRFRHVIQFNQTQQTNINQMKDAYRSFQYYFDNQFIHIYWVYATFNINKSQIFWKFYTYGIQTILMSKQGQKRCKRHGCLKYYKDEQNQQGTCHYHPGKPIFHDLKKGWTCCNKIVYDWDQFQKLPTCATAKHTDQKEQGNEFYKSNTVQIASNAIKKEQTKKIVIQDINQYNKKLQQQKKIEEAAKDKQKKKQFVTKDGKFRCINQGCRQDYLDKDNGESACKYHKGQAVFHDLKKFWSCCGKETHDWDEFMKLPACCVGWHSPKFV